MPGGLSLRVSGGDVSKRASRASCEQTRWQAEVFLQWIKQHPRIKSSSGASEKAVKTQIWIAVSIYVLIVPSSGDAPDWKRVFTRFYRLSALRYSKKRQV